MGPESGFVLGVVDRRIGWLDSGDAFRGHVGSRSSMTLQPLGVSCFRCSARLLGGDAMAGREHDVPDQGLRRPKGERLRWRGANCRQRLA